MLDFWQKKFSTVKFHGFHTSSSNQVEVTFFLPWQERTKFNSYVAELGAEFGPMSSHQELMTLVKLIDKWVKSIIENEENKTIPLNWLSKS